MDPFPDYALAYHEAWEVYLHECIFAANEAGRPLSSHEENQLLESWMTENRKKKSTHVRCCVCADVIAQHMIDGTDPFKPPANIRHMLEQFGIKVKER